MQRIFKTEDAGHRSRDVLADTVSEHHRGFDSPRPPQFGQRIFNGKQGGLRVDRLVQDASRRDLFVNRGVQDFEQGLVQLMLQQRGAALEGITKHGMTGIQTTTHAGILRALPVNRKAIPGASEIGRALSKTPGVRWCSPRTAVSCCCSQPGFQQRAPCGGRDAPCQCLRWRTSQPLTPAGVGQDDRRSDPQAPAARSGFVRRGSISDGRAVERSSPRCARPPGELPRAPRSRWFR